MCEDRKTPGQEGFPALSFGDSSPNVTWVKVVCDTVRSIACKGFGE